LESACLLPFPLSVELMRIGLATQQTATGRVVHGIVAGWTTTTFW